MQKRTIQTIAYRETVLALTKTDRTAVERVIALMEYARTQCGDDHPMDTDHGMVEAVLRGLLEDGVVTVESEFAPLF